MTRLLFLIGALLLPSAALAQLSIGDAPPVIEGKQSCNVVSRPTAENSTASFNYKTVDDTAKAGVDYVAKSGKQSVRKKTKQITICFTTIDNTTFQNDRRFKVEITPLGSLTAVRNTAFNVVRDDEVAPPVTCPPGTILDGGHCVPIPPQPIQCWDGSTVIPPATCPPQPPAQTFDLTVEGDSNTLEWPGNYIGMYRAAHPTVTIKSFATGGAGLTTLEQRLPSVLEALKPGGKFSVLIGSNDNPDQVWHNRLLVYIGKIRTAGVSVYVGTLPPQQDGTSSFSQLRPAENARIRADAAANGYKVFDIAADSALGTWSTAYYKDYVHFNDPGQVKVNQIYTPVIDGTAPPVTGWTPVPLPGASYARAVMDCSSIYRTAETDRSNPPEKYPQVFPGVTKGTVYRLVPANAWGPNPSWGHTTTPNIAGQQGNTWLVLPLDTPDPVPPYPNSSTVAEVCLEGVKQN